jgi:hypothetical protein
MALGEAVVIVSSRLCWLAVLLPMAGCGEADTARVTGTVLRQDGTPVAGARVIARSDETGQTVYGQTDTNGHFELSTAQVGAGVPPASYTMTIAEDPGDREQRRAATIAAKYSNHSRSGLNFRVAAGERKRLDLRLDPP